MKIFVLDKWKIVKYASTLIVIGFVFTLASHITNDVIETVASGNRKLPIYCIDTESNEIALTFDCAWGESR